MKSKVAYPSYRETGIPWFGLIPTYWEILRIKNSTYVKGRVGWQGLTSEEFIDEGPFLVTGTDFFNGSINWKSCYHVSEERYLQDPFIILKQGDLLITKDGTIGKIAIVKHLPSKATLNSGIFVTRPINNQYSTRYLYWVLVSEIFSGFIDYIKSGTTINHLYQNSFVDFTFPKPSWNEQEYIAGYLDRATSRINALIAKKKRLLELLAEKRAALITRAVTRGLDQNVELKDSGVEWLGKIPKHWEIKRLKYISQINPSPGNEKNIDNECEVSFLPMELIGTGTINTEIIKKYSEVRQGFTYFSEGDIIIAKITPCFENGKGAIAVGLNNGIGFGTTELHVIRPKNKKQTQFLYLISKSTLFMKYGESMMIGTAGQKRVPNNFVEDFPIPILPCNEMEKIVEFVERNLKEIGGFEEKTASVILLLQEYRSALISAAVTGQIDVRKVETS